MDVLRLVGHESVDFPILGADASGPFVLKSVEGLGPVQVRVRLNQTVLEKAIFQGKTPTLRQIIILVGLQPDWNEGQTPKDLRKQLYRLLTPRYGQMVQAQIIEGGSVHSYAQGHISKMEPALFTKDPAVVITLDCDYGYLLAPATVQQEPVQSSVGGKRAFDVINDGDAPSGFIAGFDLMATVGTTLTLSDSNPLGQKMQIKGVQWNAGDRFVIDTRPGSRGVWRGANGGALVSVLGNIDAAVSEWMYLHDGDNRLLLNTTAFDWAPEYKFAHQPAYWGV